MSEDQEKYEAEPAQAAAPQLTMSTGVVFRVKALPIFAFDLIRRKLQADRPKVPVVWIEAKSREEPNANDPEYLETLQEWETRLNERLIDAALSLGLEIVSSPLPPYAADGDWVAPFEALGIDLPVEPQQRYLAWLKLVAAPSTQDIQRIVTATCRNAGVPEGDVATAAATFPGRAERRANRSRAG